MPNPIILIPARMASVRLPDKPLALIGDRAMVIHVAQRAAAAEIAPVVIAAGDAAIAEAAEKEGLRAVLTASDLPSGSDRCLAALAEIDRQRQYDVVINLQGDMPNIQPEAIRACYQVLVSGDAALATLVAPCADEDQQHNPDQVKAVLADFDETPNQKDGQKNDPKKARVLYFSRNLVPAGAGVIWGHIGLYAWRRAALETFSSLPPSKLERRENLEQLRALAAGMKIDTAIIDRPPLSVDNPADLAYARKVMGAENAE